jgi:hypothetical protein
MDDRAAAPSDVIDHVERCLRCQAEVARYRRLLRLLGQLRTEGLEPPCGTVSEILEAVSGAARRRAVRSALSNRRLAYLSGLVLAGGAMTTLLVLGRARSHRAATTSGA